jgi:hypothetical protein
MGCVNPARMSAASHYLEIDPPEKTEYASRSVSARGGNERRGMNGLTGWAETDSAFVFESLEAQQIRFNHPVFTSEVGAIIENQ